MVGSVTAWDDLLQDFWVQVAAGVFVALVVFCLGALASRTVRDRVWRPFWRAVRWPFTLRIRSRAQLKRMADELVEARAEAAAEAARLERRAVTAELRANTAEQKAREHVDAMQSYAEDEQRRQLVEQQQKMQLAEEFGRQAGRAEAMQEVEAQRAAPIALPVWRIKSLDTQTNVFTIDNVEPNAVAEDVRLEVSPLEFAFDSSVHWPGRFFGPTSWQGERVGGSKRLPITFVVRYRDANGDWRDGAAVLDAPQLKPIVRGSRLVQDRSEPNIRDMPF